MHLLFLLIQLLLVRLSHCLVEVFEKERTHKTAQQWTKDEPPSLLHDNPGVAVTAAEEGDDKGEEEVGAERIIAKLRSDSIKQRHGEPHLQLYFSEGKGGSGHQQDNHHVDEGA
jgi:hypothetical protein